jgi:hypothetical protein
MVEISAIRGGEIERQDRRLRMTGATISSI